MNSKAKFGFPDCGCGPKWHVIGFLIAAWPVCFVSTMAAADENRPVRLALLIGVQKYVNLQASEQLDGAGNDVEAMRQLLIDRFGFAEADVVTLLNSDATGAAIREQLARLSERIRSLPTSTTPAQVVIHFSGHGSQVSDQPAGDPDRDEADGLDETLVPYDATRQGGAEDIRDDELYRTVDSICEGGKARLWIVLDCCHSGTGARGATKVRRLNRDIPVAADSVSHSEPASIAQRKLPEGAVILSACRALEVEPEYVRDGRHYGLLTRFLVQTLTEKANVSQLPYLELREAIASRYRADPSVRQPPEPQIEGDAASLNTTVLSAVASSDRDPWWSVERAGHDGKLSTLRAGSFHGMTVGSLLEVYTQPDQIVASSTSTHQSNNGNSLAWLQIESVTGATSSARVFRWDNDQQVDTRLPTGFSQGYAVERHHKSAGNELRVQVVQAMSSDSDSLPMTVDDKTIPDAIRKALQNSTAENESTWLVWTTGQQAADVLIRYDAGSAAVFPFTSGPPVTVVPTRAGSRYSPSLTGGWGPIDLNSPDAAEQLRRLLRQITRARNLLRVAALQESAPATDLSVQLELMRIEIDSDSTAITKADPWTNTNHDRLETNLMVRNGDLYTVRVTNREPAATGKPVYVTVLMVDADMGIDHLIPYQLGGDVAEETRLLPGESKLSGPFQCSGADDQLPVGGPRAAILLATREPNDFYRLTQPALAKTRAFRNELSPLEDLLQDQLYFQRTRDVRVRPKKLLDSSWTAETISWTVIP